MAAEVWFTLFLVLLAAGPVRTGIESPPALASGEDPLPERGAQRGVVSRDPRRREALRFREFEKLVERDCEPRVLPFVGGPGLGGSALGI